MDTSPDGELMPMSVETEGARLQVKRNAVLDSQAEILEIITDALRVGCPSCYVAGLNHCNGGHKHVPHWLLPTLRTITVVPRQGYVEWPYCWACWVPWGGPCNHPRAPVGHSSREGCVMFSEDCPVIPSLISHIFAMPPLDPDAPHNVRLAQLLKASTWSTHIDFAAWLRDGLAGQDIPHSHKYLLAWYKYFSPMSRMEE